VFSMDGRISKKFFLMIRVASQMRQEPYKMTDSKQLLGDIIKNMTVRDTPVC
jgi:hypothetical protein